MSAHPSIFEIDVFVRLGTTSVDFERHVSRCESCAARLTQSALRVNGQPLTLPAAGPHFRLAGVALIACLAVLVVRGVSLSPPVDFSLAPEGVHGVASAETSIAVWSSHLSDAGRADSGVR